MEGVAEVRKLRQVGIGYCDGRGTCVGYGECPGKPPRGRPAAPEGDRHRLGGVRRGGAPPAGDPVSSRAGRRSELVAVQQRRAARPCEDGTTRRYALAGLVQCRWCEQLSRLVDEDLLGGFGLRGIRRVVRRACRSRTWRRPGRVRPDAGALTARQRSWAASMSLNAMASPAARDPGPRVILVRCLTVAKVDSIGLVVLAARIADQVRLAFIRSLLLLLCAAQVSSRYGGVEPSGGVLGPTEGPQMVRWMRCSKSMIGMFFKARSAGEGGVGASLNRRVWSCRVCGWPVSTGGHRRRSSRIP